MKYSLIAVNADSTLDTLPEIMRVPVNLSTKPISAPEDLIAISAVMTVLSACYYLPQTENGEAKTDAFGNALRLYDVTKNETLWKKIQVGSEDFLYKFGHGYMCYASGLYYEGTGEKSYEKHASRGHFVVKDLWRRCLLPLGTVEPST